MWRRVPCEQQLNMGQSALRKAEKSVKKDLCCQSESRTVKVIFRKGIGLIFPNLDTGIGSSEPSAVTQTSPKMSAEVRGRVVFSL